MSMPRRARIVLPNLPHHVIQRGNRRRETFFQGSDYQFYLALLGEWCLRFGVRVLAYCLMPNHVHLVLVPSDTIGLSKAMAEVHRRYTKQINRRENWKGFLWQCRFSSYAMDHRHLLAAARYIELNPVKAGIVDRPQDYLWSSAAAHLGLTRDPVADIPVLLEHQPDWAEFLKAGIPAVEHDVLKAHERTGKPAIAEHWPVD